MTYKSGSKAEKIYEDELKADGYWTHRNIKSRFGKQDIFGCDIIAVGVGVLMFIQVKSRQDRFPAMEKQSLNKLKKLWLMLPDESIEVWWVGYNFKKKKWKQAYIDMSGEWVVL